MPDVTVDQVGWDDVEVVRELRLAALGDAPDAFWATLDDERDQPATWWRQRVVGDHNAVASATYARHGSTPSGETGRFLPPRVHITEHELPGRVTGTHD